MPQDAQIDAVAELRQQLVGKDELISALVAELEQVAEQLDRVKRNGGDRPRAGGGGVLPPEVIEEHQQMLGEMQRFVQEWEELQTPSTLRRIESDLSELRSLITQGRFQTSAPEDNSHDDEHRDESGSAGVVTLSGTDWEAMKRQMVGEAEPPAEEQVEDDLVKLLDGVVAPSPIDFDSVSFESLKRACAERDTYIVQITRWVRTRRAVTLPESWDDLPEVPEELRQRVDHLAARLEEQVRLAEVEMSLERARLSRERSQLQADRAVMDRHLKRLGIQSLDELEDIAVSSSSTGDRRWMRFLGVNRKS